MFLLPLLLLRGRSWLDRVDLAALLTFGVSYLLFNNGHLEPGVWMFYPPLLYLMFRMLVRGFRPRRVPRPLDCRLPTALFAAGLLALIVARIVITLHPASVIDVGTASVLGAYRILHGQSLYYFSLGHPDTYGPLAYLAYVPFEAIWPGNWGYMPAARAATITFDLMTIAALIVLGMRLRPGREGRRLGLLLAWLWAACPWSLLGMEKSTNDGLVALIVVLVVLALKSPIKRGALVGIGAASKFFPAILLPVVAVGPGETDRSTVRKVLAGFVIAVGASIAIFLPPGGLGEIWDHTIGFQLTRTDIFSIWALHPGLAPVKVAVEAFAVILAVAVAFRPRGARTPAQVAALAASTIIAVQLPALHWFYLYIPWFLPLVLIAVLGAEAPPARTPRSRSGRARHGEPSAPRSPAPREAEEMPIAFAAAFAGVFGATIGSFLNVVAYRLPRHESLVRPGSRCPGCGTAIKTYDNVPVLGWLLLRGRCRSCRTSISPRYPIVEATTAALAAAVVLTKHSAVDVVLGLVLVAVLVPVALIDLDHRIIPNKITLPAALAAVAIGCRARPARRARAADRGRGRRRVPALLRARLPAGDGDGRRQAGRCPRAVPWTLGGGGDSRRRAARHDRRRRGDGAGRRREGAQDGRAVRPVPGARRDDRPVRRAGDHQLVSARGPLMPTAPLPAAGRPSLFVAMLAILAGGLLTATRRDCAAGAAACRDPHRPQFRASSRALPSGWNHVTATPLDDQLEHVSFWTGGQLVAEAAVNGRDRAVGWRARDEPVPYGNWIAYQPVLLSAGLPVRADGAVTPWRRLRNLDALAAESLVVPVILFQHRYLSSAWWRPRPASICWLAARAWPWPAGPPAASTPLLMRLPPASVRPARPVAALVLAVLALVFVMVGVGSPSAVDVPYAAMEGATRLIHGVLPYGHLPPGIIHGDTYPILSYALYTPLALVAPVNPSGTRSTVGLRSQWRRRCSPPGPRDGRWRVDRTRAPAGGRGGGAARGPGLAFPAVLITASTGTTDLALAAMLASPCCCGAARRPVRHARGRGLVQVRALRAAAGVPAPLRGRRLIRRWRRWRPCRSPSARPVVALGGARGRDMVHSDVLPI